MPRCTTEVSEHGKRERKRRETGGGMPRRKKMSVRDVIRARFVRSARRRRGIAVARPSIRERKRQSKRYGSNTQRQRLWRFFARLHPYFAVDRPDSPGRTLCSSQHAPLLPVKLSRVVVPSTSSRRRAPRRSESEKEKDREREREWEREEERESARVNTGNRTRQTEVPNDTLVRGGARETPSRRRRRRRR